MSAPWLRMPPGRLDTLQAGMAAGVVAVGAGIVAFYVARLVLAREPFETGDRLDPGAPGADAERSTGADG